MSTKHTPGPWNNYEGEIMHDGALVAQVMNEDDFPCLEQVTVEVAAECEANAHLIAAAPEMLETLKTSLHRLERIDGFGCPQEILDAMHAAIAKAEGKQ